MELQFKGHTIYLDKEDYHYLKEINFGIISRNYTNYLCNDHKKIHLHRLIMNCPKDKFIDHINGNGLDNRRCNLRICSRSQNGQNRKPNKKASSKYKGVSWHKATKKWKSYIKINKTLKYLGLFEREREAAKAYNYMAIKNFGEFSKLNEFNHE